MKCSIMLHFIRVYTVCKGKKDLQIKEQIFFEKYNLTALDMYNGLSQVYCINQKEESISIQRVKHLEHRNLSKHLKNVLHSLNPMYEGLDGV